jgi:hypothetical protein
MRRWIMVLSMAASLSGALAVPAAQAQPPVARPQPPPPAPAQKVPAKPGPAAAPAQTPVTPAQPGAKPAAPAPAQAPQTRTATPPEVADVPPAACKQATPVLSGSQYLASYDAGMGQTYCIYGSTLAFADVVTYYRTALKDRGELVFDAPATHMFEVGKFKETDVAFPPGVTVKDYTWGGSPGYMNPKPGATPEFFPTVIQIVPPPSPTAARRN